MQRINDWFERHPDATLITDKVNQPTAFAAEFIDPNRLMMELFSWPAVEEATLLSLQAVVPTGDLLFKIPGNPAPKLKQLGIEYIAASRRWVDAEPRLLRQLNQGGIHILAFHVGFAEGKDESHVVCHERQHFYGLYADQWDFTKLPTCADQPDP